jgi:Flp pilus assembly protein TadD
VDLASFERAFRRRGLDGAARELHLGQVDVQAFSRATFQYNVALARARQARGEEAEAAFRKALEMNPYYFEAYRELAQLLSDRGAPDEAVAPYRSALRLRPHDADVQLSLGLTLLASGDRPGAEACLAWLSAHAPRKTQALAAALAADRED